MNTAEILKKVRKIEIKTGRAVNEIFAGKYHSVFKGRGIEFSEVREYVPGDDVRDIDWNVTARFSRPYVKKYEEERELNLLILCDVSGSQFFGSKDVLKNELSAEIGAAFAFSALKNNDKIGLMLFSDRPELYIPPRKGKNHALRIIRELLAYAPESRKTGVSKALDEASKLLKRNSIVLLISDFLDEGFEKSLKLAKIKHDIIPIIIYDEVERKLPHAGAFLTTENIETGETVTAELSDRRYLEEYERLNAAWRNENAELFKRLGLGYIELSPERDIYREIAAFFKGREKKKWG